jgi:hypothetical protein
MYYLLTVVLGIISSADAELINSLSSTLTIPIEYQVLTSNRSEWLDAIYQLDLSPSKEFVFNEEQYQNTINAYLSPYPYRPDPSILFLSDLKGDIYQRPTIHISSSFVGGDVSAWSQGIGFSEHLSNHLTWGAGFTRSQINNDKRYPSNEGAYNTVNGWLDWRPSENFRMYLGVSHTDKE